MLLCFCMHINCLCLSTPLRDFRLSYLVVSPIVNSWLQRMSYTAWRLCVLYSTDVRDECGAVRRLLTQGKRVHPGAVRRSSGSSGLGVLRRYRRCRRRNAGCHSHLLRRMSTGEKIQQLWAIRSQRRQLNNTSCTLLRLAFSSARCIDTAVNPLQNLRDEYGSWYTVAVSTAAWSTYQLTYLLFPYLVTRGPAKFVNQQKSTTQQKRLFGSRDFFNW